MARRRYQPYFLRDRTRKAYNSGWFNARRGTPWSKATFGVNKKEASGEQRFLRKAVGFKGNGAYWGQQAGKWLGNLAGKYTGISELGALGAKYGDIGSSWVEKNVASQATNPNSWARKRLRSLTGMGAYAGDVPTSSTANDLFVDRVTPDSTPNFISDPDEVGCVYVNFQEYLTDVVGNATPGTTEVTVLEVNPGLESSFPFLSQIALCFEEYEMMQLVYVYTPDISDSFVTNDGTTGTVYFATQYNLSNAPLTNFRQFETSPHKSSGLVFQSILHGVEMDPSKVVGRPSKYTRTGPLKPGQSGIDYDPCFLQFAVYDTPTPLANRRLGKIHVQYTVKLRRPRQYSDRIDNSRQFMVVGSCAGAQSTFGLVAPMSSPFGFTSTTLPTGGVRALLAQQNSLPLRYIAEDTGPTLATVNTATPLWDPIFNVAATAMPQWTGLSAAASSMRVEIPHDFTGVLEIKIMVEVSVLSTAPAGIFIINPPLLQGNVRPIYDQMGGSVFEESENSASRDVPTSITRSNIRTAQLSTQGGTFHLIMRVSVDPPPPGKINALVWSHFARAAPQTTGLLNSESFAGASVLCGSLSPNASLAVASSSLTITEISLGLAQSASNPVPLFLDSVSGAAVSPF